MFAKSNQEWENLLDKVGKEGIGQMRQLIFRGEATFPQNVEGGVEKSPKDSS